MWNPWKPNKQTNLQSLRSGRGDWGQKKRSAPVLFGPVFRRDIVRCVFRLLQTISIHQPKAAVAWDRHHGYWLTCISIEMDRWPGDFTWPLTQPPHPRVNDHKIVWRENPNYLRISLEQFTQNISEISRLVIHVFHVFITPNSNGALPSKFQTCVTDHRHKNKFQTCVVYISNNVGAVCCVVIALHCVCHGKKFEKKEK